EAGGASEEGGAGGLVGEQGGRELEGQEVEQVDDGVLVVPEPEGVDEDKRRYPPRADGGHLGGDHAAHRVADEDGAVDAEGVDDVPPVEREVEHVLERLLA